MGDNRASPAGVRRRLRDYGRSKRGGLAARRGFLGLREREGVDLWVKASNARLCMKKIAQVNLTFLQISLALCSVILVTFRI